MGAAGKLPLVENPKSAGKRPRAGQRGHIVKHGGRKVCKQGDIGERLRIDGGGRSHLRLLDPDGQKGRSLLQRKFIAVDAAKMCGERRGPLMEDRRCSARNAAKRSEEHTSELQSLMRI